MRRLPMRDRQRGSVLVPVMVFMALLMLFGGTLVNHVLTAEAVEVEALLAETRAYWAMNGHLNYMLSRAAGQGLCAGTKLTTQAANAALGCAGGDSDGTTGSRAGSLQDYLDAEIQTAGSPAGLSWYYPQNATAAGAAITAANALNDANPYRFAVRGAVSKWIKPDGTTAAGGQLRLDLDVVSVGTVSALRTLADRVGRLTVGFCVADMQSDGGTGYAPVSPTGSCFTGAAITDEGRSRVQFVQRNHPFTSLSTP